MIWWSSSCFNPYERKLIMHLQDKYLWFEIENLSNCRFNPDDPADKYCPIFVLKDIVSGTGSRYDELSGQVHWQVLPVIYNDVNCICIGLLINFTFELSSRKIKALIFKSIGFSLLIIVILMDRLLTVYTIFGLL